MMMMMMIIIDLSQTAHSCSNPANQFLYHSLWVINVRGKGMNQYWSLKWWKSDNSPFRDVKLKYYNWCHCSYEGLRSMTYLIEQLHYNYTYYMWQVATTIQEKTVISNSTIDVTFFQLTLTLWVEPERSWFHKLRAICEKCSLPAPCSAMQRRRQASRVPAGLCTTSCICDNVQNPQRMEWNYAKRLLSHY